MVGGDYVARNYAAASIDGRIVQIAFLHGPRVELDLRPLMMKRLIHTGSTLRPRSAAEKAVIAEALHAKVWPLLASGRCKPIIDSVFPLAEVAEAHARMESSAHIGKIVLTLVSGRPVSPFFTEAGVALSEPYCHPREARRIQRCHAAFPISLGSLARRFRPATARRAGSLSRG